MGVAERGSWAVFRLEADRTGKSRDRARSCRLVFTIHRRKTNVHSQLISSRPRLIGTNLRFDESQIAAAAFLARYQRPDSGRLPPRPPFLLPVGIRRPSVRPRGHPSSHRALPHRHGREVPRSVDHRSAAVDGLWLLSLRPHRRSGGRQPSPVRPSTQSPPFRGPGFGPSGVRHPPLHGGTVRPGSCGPRRPPRVERPPGKRGVRDERRGHRLRSWAPDTPGPG